MNEYQKQAVDFLEYTGAKLAIEPLGMSYPKWDKHNQHATYRVTLSRGKRQIDITFCDNRVNTENLKLTAESLAKRLYKTDYQFLSGSETKKVLTELRRIKAESVPNEYDILACLTKYDVGTMQDFMDDFGYEIKNTEDMFDFMETYHAVVKEYRDLCSMFNSDEMERLAEIN